MKKQTPKTVVFTLGRNVGQRPMPVRDWSAFTSRAHRLASEVGTVVCSPHTAETAASARHPRGAHGLWEGKTIEDCTAYVVLVDGEDALVDLAAGLKSLGETFEQEAIGFVVAEGHDNLLICE